jgi:hypothetical protein
MSGARRVTDWEETPITAPPDQGGAAGDVALPETPDADALLLQLQAHPAGAPLRFLADRVRQPCRRSSRP